ncbi:MAG TPA: hypothetical protein IGS17_08945 [Oscillatoriales cyanobacterium M59_W2019_021]|nr:hypothetical protein [Oscillatoriales cyanobacterium M59_W2019_021]
MHENRLAQIEENLELLYEQLGAIEQGSLMTPDPMAKAQAKQRIRKEIKPEIRKYELEYLQVLQQNASEFADEDAQAVIDVLAEEVQQIQSLPSSSSPEILEILQRIEAKLNEPGTTAAAKLKGTLSLMPPFVNVSYETELDTENFFRKYFPTFTAATRRLRGKKP